MNDVDAGILTESYALIRLVYINSANHGYSEIMLDKHLAMFGRNNAGKTASLAGTKLLLFPEIDFFNCPEKFRFIGKNGPYSTEESYDFYFPDRRSFIILEVKNPEGIFCMVLYKTNNYGYGRFFIPVEYGDIRSIFWNIDDKNYAPDISIEAVSKFSKNRDGLQVTNANEIADLIFSSFRDVKAKKRFCVVPLKDGRKDSVLAFRRIYQLAFEVESTADVTLPAAVAALLEMGRSRDQERLDANLTQLSDEHSQLMQRRDWLQRLTNSQPLFESAKKTYYEAKQEQVDYSAFFRSVQDACTSAKHHFTPKIIELNSQYQTISNQLDSVNEKIELLIQKNSRAKGALELAELTKKRKSESLENSLKLRSSYGDKSVFEILEILNEDLNEQKNLLVQYQQEGGVQLQLAENLRARNILNANVLNLENLIANAQSTVLHQLESTEAINVFYSLNKAFANIVVDLDNHAKNSMHQFSSLFGKDGANCITFLGVSVNEIPFSVFDLDTQLAAWKEEIDKKRKRIRDIDKNIVDQKAAVQHDNIKDLLEKTKKEIISIEKDVNAIGGIGSLEREVEDTQNTILEMKIGLDSDTNELNSLKNKQSELKGKWSEIKSIQERLKEQEVIIDMVDTSLKNARPYGDVIDVDYEPYDIDKLSKEVAQKILERATVYNNSFTNFKSVIMQLQLELPHPELDNHQYYNDLLSYSNVVSAYENSFATLEYDRLQHLNAIRTHNQLVNNQLNELKESKSLLFNYVAEINRELNCKHISNLSHIELSLELNSSFLSLLETLEKHDIQDESLLEARFYESLAVFVDNYFNRKTRRLKLRDIISSITYRYTLAETGEPVKTGQSGGTTSTITAFVLAVLLKRITPEYVRLQMPIVVDEIGTIDYGNADSTIKQIAEHGFSIFCATPNFSAFIARKVGRWIMIDRAMVKHPLVSKCHMNILPHYCESYGEQMNES